MEVQKLHTLPLRMPICYKFGLWINMAGVVEEKACFVSLCV